MNPIDLAANAGSAPACIGLFDSGVGGLSLLRAIRARLPAVPTTYIADNRHLPYGDKSAQWLQDRAFRLTEALLDDGARLVVVACNTATTHTIAALRQRWPTIAFVGVEPGVKPAALASRKRSIAVMATPATIRSQRLQALIRDHAEGTVVHLLPCPGLADAIERAEPAPLGRMLDEVCAQLDVLGVDTVALGCTHYPLVAPDLARRLSATVQWIDTTDAVARRVASLWPTACDAPPPGVAAARPTVRIRASGALEPIDAALRRWLEPPYRLEPLDGAP